ncbi:MAG TPA: nucleotidyltransferase domain-containing protein [Micromonosporaceae bacterium]|jgi:predicted nucleotidyltransferase
MLEPEFVDRWVQRLRCEVPDAVAILIGGSHLRGDAGRDSDVDFDVLVPTGPRDEWPAYFDTDGDRLVRISTWVRDVDAWLATENEPQSWAFFLASADPMRLCWVADESWRERVDRTSLVHPVGPPEIDHFEGEVGKVTNAWRRGDELALRLAARDLADAVVSLLAVLNPRPPVESRRHALLTLLDFDTAPTGYRDDMLTCLGLASEHRTVADVRAAALRLASGVMDLVEANAAVFAPLLPPDAAEAIRAGTLGRYIRQAINVAPRG